MFEEYVKLGHKKFMNEMEKNLILQALEKTRWNITNASVLIKMNRTTLVMKMQKLKLRKER